MNTIESTKQTTAQIDDQHAPIIEQTQEAGSGFATAAAVSLAASGALTACGGGGGAPGAGADLTSTPPGKALSVPFTADEYDAWRFLTQATFGPKFVDGKIADAKLGVNNDFKGWLDEQFLLKGRKTTVEMLRPRYFPNCFREGVVVDAVTSAVWEQFVFGPDQLRQRVAFALSEIFVISVRDGFVGNLGTGVAYFHDMLLKNAFGSLRTLVEDVCKHPIMGVYLSHLKNKTPGSEGAGVVPDQNFARELMQLFTIGQVNLNMDGTPKTVGGQEVKSYTQDDIEVMSYVFTGWTFGGLYWDITPTNEADLVQFLTRPMECWDGTGTGQVWIGEELTPELRDRGRVGPWVDRTPWHTDSHTSIVGFNALKKNGASEVKLLGTTFKPTGTGEGDLKNALDILLSHPNVAPFLSKQMIQRLVTSNPTPAYVGRVAANFKASGYSLKTLVQSILLDPEARGQSVAPLASTTFGKLREPVLRITAALRAFDAQAADFFVPRTWEADVIDGSNQDYTNIGQGPYQSPSVFNFFRQGHVPSGTEMGKKGLFAPEMQATTETQVALYTSTVMRMVVNQRGFGGLLDRGAVFQYKDYRVASSQTYPNTSLPAYAETAPRFKFTPSLEFDFRDLYKLISGLDGLGAGGGDMVDLIDVKLLGGKMSAALRADLMSVCAASLAPVSAMNNKFPTSLLRKVALCVGLTMVSSDFVVQK